MAFNHSTLALILVASTMCMGQAIKLSAAQEEKAAEDWSGNPKLPKIQVTPIRPIKDIETFLKDPYSEGFVFKAHESMPTAPFDSDQEAEMVARAFLAEHFGALPFELRISQIQRSASGHKAPVDEADQGHTISFRPYWNGIELQGYYATVYIKGRVIKSASVEFGRPEIVPGSTRAIVSRKHAVRSWQQMAIKYLKAPKGISPKVVSLVYVWSASDYVASRYKAKEGSVLAPNWSIRFNEHSAELLVDAYTGKVWRND